MSFNAIYFSNFLIFFFFNLFLTFWTAFDVHLGFLLGTPPAGLLRQQTKALLPPKASSIRTVPLVCGEVGGWGEEGGWRELQEKDYYIPEFKRIFLFVLIDFSFSVETIILFNLTL